MAQNSAHTAQYETNPLDFKLYIEYFEHIQSKNQISNGRDKNQKSWTISDSSMGANVH